MSKELILVVNAGSSSLKWALFNYQDLGLVASGMVERIGLSGGISSTKIIEPQGELKEERDFKDHSEAVRGIVSG